MTATIQPAGALAVEPTRIPGLLVLRLPVHADARGWFKENWQRQKMLEAGVPDFGPVQNNISFNARRGVTRGLHAEPWDKLVSVAAGRVFAAWVDLRRGHTFGTTLHLELDASVAVFVPRGVANGYQALEDATSYSYLVNDHWRPDAGYAALDLADPMVGLPWPVPLAEAEVSEKDRHNPRLDAVVPVPPRRPLVLGGDGQVGRAFAHAFPDAEVVGRDRLDLTDVRALEEWPWHEHDVVLNAAAHTAVDASETPAGRRLAWSVNAQAPAVLARLATRHRLTLVHVSTDYAFDGTRSEHPEDEPFSPLGVYGQSKAAGDLAVSTTPRHYLLRTSWVIGEGPNFVRTMLRLAREGACPRVVDDQVGRLTFADELARATRHLLETGAPFGTYNVTNGGPPTTWADVARWVFCASGRDRCEVIAVPTAEYDGDATAPRPADSTLDLSRLRATGFEPTPWRAALGAYLSRSEVGGT